MNRSMTLEEAKKIVLSDCEVEKNYDEVEPEYQILIAVASERKKQNISQQKLADMTGIDRADISRIENAESNPTVGTLKRIAKALDRKLVIELKK